MTVSFSTRRTTIGPLAFGATVLAVPFPVKSASQDLRVMRIRGGVETVLTYGVDWTWTPATLPATGGSVVLVAGAFEGDVCTVDGAYPISRPRNLTPADIFASNPHNAELDRIWMTLQEVARDLVSIGTGKNLVRVSPEDVTLPLEGDRAGKLLGFDAIGNPQAVAPVAGGALGVGDILGTTPLGQALLSSTALSSVQRQSFASQIGAGYVSPRMFGAVLNGSPADQALVKSAALYALSQNLPFMVPTTGLTLQVPEDVATLQQLHDKTLDWFVPKLPVPQNSPHTRNYALVFDCAPVTTVMDGYGFVWSHPSGTKIKVQGRGKELLTTPAKYAYSNVGGHFLTLQCFAPLNPAMAVDQHIQITYTTGPNSDQAGAGHQIFRGTHQISAIDFVNNRVTLRVMMGGGPTDYSAVTFTTITAYWMPCAFQFLNMPYDGADRGAFDVREFSTLCCSDIVVSGYSAGSNASSTNGFILRLGATLRWEQHVGVLQFPRAGVWCVEKGSAMLDFGAISACNICLNLLLGSAATGSYLAANGATSTNIVVGIDSSFSGNPLAICGAGQFAARILNGGNFISGGAAGSLAGYSPLGIVTEGNSVATLNDLPVTNCSTTGCESRGGSISVSTSHKVANNTVNFLPDINIGGYVGMNSSNPSVVTALSTTIVATATLTVPALAAHANDETVLLTVVGAKAGKRVTFTTAIAGVVIALPNGVMGSALIKTDGIVTFLFTNTYATASTASTRNFTITIDR